MIKLKKIGDSYNLSGSKEELLSLTREALDEIFKLTDEIAATDDALEKRKNSPYLKLIIASKQTTIKPWLN